MDIYLRIIPILGMIILSSCSNNMFAGGAPFVYSFDGKQYQLEAEAYPEAQFKAWERTDYLMLEHLVPVKEEYRLKIVSEREKNYVNELRLLIVDHPAGTKLLPGEDGRLYTLSNPGEPLSALDKKLNSILPLINKRDDKSWGASFSLLSSLMKGPDWDWINLSFNRPKNLLRAKLLIEAVNTPQASLMERNYLAEKEYGSGKGIKKMEELPEELQEFRQWKEENLTLQIRLWNGDTWELMAKVRPVGSRAGRKLVFPLDAGKVRGEYIKLRLKTTSLVWRVDRVAIDYSLERDIAVKEGRLIEAPSSSGNRLSGLLRRMDDKYYVAGEGESAEFIFRAIPEIKGYQRSYLMKIGGYYQAQSPEPGEEILDELNRVLKRFFGQG
jgi:hypothetical protein